MHTSSIHSFHIDISYRASKRAKSIAYKTTRHWNIHDPTYGKENVDEKQDLVSFLTLTFHEKEYIRICIFNFVVVLVN